MECLYLLMYNTQRSRAF